jgi:hypothetical protein
MAQVTEENLHALWILGRLSAGKRYSFSLARVRVIRRYYIILYFHVITGGCNTLRIT